MIPTIAEFYRGPGEADDPLGEDGDSPVPGLVHRYPDRVLLLVTDFCSSYCRYCTRSRMVGHGSIAPAEARLELAFDYIRRTPAIRDVLISGGDPLALSDERLDWILSRLARNPARRVPADGHKDARRAAAADHPRAVPDAAEAPSAVDEPALPPSRRMHARVVPGLHAAGRRRHPARFADGAAGRRERQRRDDEAVGPPAAADAGPPVLPLPVRPDHRLGPFPHAGVEGSGDHRGPARPYDRLRGAQLRDRRPRRRRQDPLAAELRRRPRRRGPAAAKLPRETCIGIPITCNRQRETV